MIIVNYNNIMIVIKSFVVKINFIFVHVQNVEQMLVVSAPVASSLCNDAAIGAYWVTSEDSCNTNSLL